MKVENLSFVVVLYSYVCNIGLLVAFYFGSLSIRFDYDQREPEFCCCLVFLCL